MAAQKRLERAQRVVVRRNGVLEILGNPENVVDDVYGDIAGGGNVDDCGVVALIQNMRLAVGASRPRDNLRLVTLEMHGLRVVIQSPPESHVGVLRRGLGEIPRDDVVRKDVGKDRGVSGNVTWYLGDYMPTLVRSRTGKVARMTYRLRRSARR